MPLDKNAILSSIVRIEREEQSAPFGGALLLRELTRAEYRAIATAADMGNDQINIDQWNGGLFAAGVIDPVTHAPAFTLDEVLTFPQRGALWDEIKRIATCILDLSEVGAGPLLAPSTD
jgi:hypothetical protein